jgi:hypothetical protein
MLSQAKAWHPAVSQNLPAGGQVGGLLETRVAGNPWHPAVYAIKFDAR